MTTTQHTNGPWNHKEQWGYYKIHSEDEGVSVVHGIDPKAEANARLISAAPDMFQALQAICDAFGDQNSLLVDQCKAALAKARGEA